MSGWVLAISKTAQENWPLGRAAGIWATGTRCAIRAGDDVFFWKVPDGLIAHGIALADASEPDDAIYAALPWPDRFQESGARRYAVSFPMQILEEISTARPERWTALQEQLNIRTGLNTGPVSIPAVGVDYLRGLFRPDIAFPPADAVITMSSARSLGNTPALDPETDVAIAVHAPPSSIDPDTVGAALQRHNRTVLWFFEQVRARGLVPLNPPGFLNGEPDVLWQSDSQAHVVEVKGLTDLNQRDQLRKGLGQVLHYRYLLERAGFTVTAWLGTNVPPTDPDWHGLCRAESVRLWWPERGTAPVATA